MYATNYNHVISGENPYDVYALFLDIDIADGFKFKDVFSESFTRSAYTSNLLAFKILDVIENPDLGLNSIERAREIYFAILNSCFSKSQELLERLRNPNPQISAEYHPALISPSAQRVRDIIDNPLEDGVVSTVLSSLYLKRNGAFRFKTPELRAFERFEKEAAKIEAALPILLEDIVKAVQKLDQLSI